jgi:ABC-2 type transport system permease protein
MRRLLTLTRYMVRMFLRDRYILFWNTVFPVFLLLIFGAVFGTMRVDGQPYMAWALPGMVVLNLMAFGLIRSSATMVEMRQQGVLRQLRATPVPALHLVASYIVVDVLLCLAQSAMLVLVAVMVYKVPLTAQGAVRALPMVLAGALTFIALGQLFSSVLTSISAAIGVGQVLHYSLMFVSDLFMPQQSLPNWLQHVAAYLPAYAVVQAVRPPLLAQAWRADVAWYLLMVVLYGVVATLLTARLFRWEPQQ